MSQINIIAYETIALCSVHMADFCANFLLLTILTALFTMVGCLLGGDRVFSYYPGMIWSRLTCWLAFCPVKVRGREHIRKGQSYVFAANHQGAFDIFLIYGFWEHLSNG